MGELQFPEVIDHLNMAISSAGIQEFGVPHLVADNVVPPGFLDAINARWPSGEAFDPETTGNHIRTLYREHYGRLPESDRQFWVDVNERFWPHLVAAVANAFHAHGRAAFGDLFGKLQTEVPMSLMQADPDYRGHAMHNHFYHCPHWAFTMLFYVDPDERISRGTGLQRLVHKGGPVGESSYLTEDLDWRTDLAMSTFLWQSDAWPDAAYESKVTDYRANRLFVFFDGPLAFHDVPFDNPDFSPDPRRAEEGGRFARRRILRCHVKINDDAFYGSYSAHFGQQIEMERFGRIMRPNASVSEEDEAFRKTLLRPFYRERIRAGARPRESASSDFRMFDAQQFRPG